MDDDSGLPSALNTYKSLIDAFSDFLVAAVHLILFQRAIYPKDSFMRVRKYNFPTWQSRHPGVCKWISNAVTSVERELLKCSVARTSLVIISKQHVLLERYVFSTDSFPRVLKSDILTRFTPIYSRDTRAVHVGDDTDSKNSADQTDNEGDDGIGEYDSDIVSEEGKVGASQTLAAPNEVLDERASGDDEDDEVEKSGVNIHPKHNNTTGSPTPEMSVLQEEEPGLDQYTSILDLTSQFAAVLARVEAVSEDLEPLPEGSTYTMAIELHRNAGGQTLRYPQNGGWIPSDPEYQLENPSRCSTDRLATLNQSTPVVGISSNLDAHYASVTTPLRSIDAEPFLMEAWLESIGTRKAKKTA